MLAVTFSASGDDNCVVVSGRPYVLARPGGELFVLPASCPHRGGPLPLGQLDARGRLICPWHENPYSCAKGRDVAVPFVRRANRVTAVFPHGDHDAVTKGYHPVSKALGGAGSAPADRIVRGRP